MNITIISVGKIKEIFYKDACSEYVKRLSRFGKLKIYEVPECRGVGDTQDIEKEGKFIIKTLNPSDFIVALCIEGTQMTSVSFADFINTSAINGYGAVTFIIGGSNGLSDEVKNHAHKKISFSKMTFPHMLMRVILLEQVYRAFKIISGETYHK